MKRFRLIVLAITFIFILSLTACGDSRETTADKLVSAYFDVGESDSTVSVLKTEAYGNGFLAMVLYTGSGDHLLLFEIEKGSAGEYAITYAGEGSAAKDCGYSVNVLQDGDKAILFGNLISTTGFTMIDFTFEDGSSKKAGISGAQAYILILEGEGKIKDFTLTGKDNAEAGSYKDYVSAGNSITRTGFMKIASE